MGTLSQLRIDLDLWDYSRPVNIGRAEEPLVFPRTNLVAEICNRSQQSIRIRLRYRAGSSLQTAPSGIALHILVEAHIWYETLYPCGLGSREFPGGIAGMYV